jgi:hypothetical protein
LGVARLQGQRNHWDNGVYFSVQAIRLYHPELINEGRSVESLRDGCFDDFAVMFWAAKRLLGLKLSWSASACQITNSASASEVMSALVMGVRRPRLTFSRCGVSATGHPSWRATIALCAFQ